MTALKKIEQWDEVKGEGWSIDTKDIAKIMDEYLKEKVKEYCKKLWDNSFNEGEGRWCVDMDNVENILQVKK
jgi:hypothetical protein